MQTVLVVENNRMIRMMYSAGLSGYGYRVLEAQNLRESLAHLEVDALPEFIVLDLKLPDGSGEQVLRVVRGEMQNYDTKIIIASGLELSEDEVEQVEADAYLIKPIELGDLLTTVRSLGGAG